MNTFFLSFRISVFLSFVLFVAGCATNLERADRLFAEGQYEKASRYYLKEYEKQRESAVLPKWKQNRYYYDFNAKNAAAGMLGAAKSFKAMGKKEQMTLFLARLTAFCQRHELPMNWAAEIKGVAGAKKD